MSNNRKILSIVLALILALSVIPTMPLSVSAEETGYTAPEGFTPEPNKIYFDVNGTGWEMGAKDKVAFYIYDGDFGTEANPTTPFGWGTKKPIGTATKGVSGMYEIDPAAKLGYTFTEGVKYKISFIHISGIKWIEQTHDLYFTTDCLGHVAYCNGETRPYEIDPSKSALVPHWDLEDLDGGFLYRYHRYLNAQGEMDIDPACLDITGYAGNESDLEIPAAIDSLPVVKIADNAFEDNENLKSVKLPDSVTSIGSGAFSGCTGLTEINIPSSITTIKDRTFNYCTALTSITIPDAVTEIGDYAFSRCTGLTEIVIPDSVTEIGEGAFEGCTGLTSITIPDAVTKIEDYAFSRCTGLTKIVIPESVTSIGAGAFSGCTGLTEIVIPDSVTEIGEGAFKGCTGLTIVKLPDSITGIEDDTFAGCTGLTDFTLPSSIEYVAKTAFEETDFEGIWYNDQPDGVLYWGTSAMDYKGICPETVEIRPGTTKVEGFNDQTTLKTIIFPDGLRDITGFYNCTDLKSVTIPKSVESITASFGKTTVYVGSWQEQRTRYFDVTMYGYPGTEAERFVRQFESPDAGQKFVPGFVNHFSFVPLTDVTDTCGVSVSVAEGQELSVEDITDTFDKTALPKTVEMINAYDIGLKKDSEAVQPDHVVTVKIPCDDPDAKVYRKEADGSLTDMNAVYQDGYLSFKTTHFSVYIVATGAEVDLAICGDTDGDGEVTISDATLIQRYCAGSKVNIDPETMMNADVDGNGEIEIIDATFICRYLTGIPTPYAIGTSIE